MPFTRRLFGLFLRTRPKGDFRPERRADLRRGSGLSKPTTQGGMYKMYYNKVDLCGINTARLPVLKEREKTQLLRTIRQGGSQAEAARESMISGNLRLVLSVVQKFSSRCGGRGGSRTEELDDLFQVGCIGLIKAIDNFDINQGVRFSTYGVPMIVGEIRRFLRDDAPIRVSRSVRDLAYRAMQAREDLQKERGREATTAQIAQRLGV